MNRRCSSAHRCAEFLREIKNPFLEWLDMAVARARAFGKSDQADAGIERGLGASGHQRECFAAGRVGNSDVAEAAHQPAVDGDFEMRFKFEAANELRDRGINHEGVEQVYMIADEYAGARAIEAGRVADLEAHARKAKNIAEENALRPIVFTRVNKNAESDEQRANDGEMNSADDPKNCRANREPRALHTITSSAAGSISSERQCSRRISPSTITFTGAGRSRSMRRAAAREARRCSMCVPVKSRGSVQRRRRRPTGLQRTYSIWPSVGSAFGAIIIFPPVNLLLLKVRKRHGRRSQSAASPTR